MLYVAVYLTAHQLRMLSGREMYGFCVRHDLPDVWAYMYNSWYSSEWWGRWARSARPDNIPMAKTTMMIEAHWRVLKREFLLPFPRPRLDLLVWVITRQQLLIASAKFELKIKNRRVPLEWESEFSRSWTALTRAIADERRQDGGENPNAERRYLPSLEKWTCGCLSFKNSRYMLCKHLVKRYNDSVRRTSRLFHPLQVTIIRKDTKPYIKLEAVCPFGYKAWGLILMYNAAAA